LCDIAFLRHYNEFLASTSGKNIKKDNYYNKRQKEADLEKTYSDILLNTSWASLSAGLSLSFTSILLSIISNIYEFKALKKFNNNLNDIPLKLIPWSVYKKINVCSLIFIIDGSLLLLSGIFVTFYNHIIKTYTLYDAGVNEAYPILISFFTMGGVFSFAALIQFLCVKMSENKKNNEQDNLTFNPVIEFSNSLVKLGLKIEI